jgi:hypothetical protein
MKYLLTAIIFFSCKKEVSPVIKTIQSKERTAILFIDSCNCSRGAVNLGIFNPNGGDKTYSLSEQQKLK